MTKIRLGAVLPLSALVLVLACSSDPESTTPKAGESCSGAGTGACNDPKSALFCKDGVWTLAPCNGAEGCNDSGDKIVCDFTMGKEGDVCIIAEGAAANACSLDGTKTLKCQDNKWVPEVDCSGPNKVPRRREGRQVRSDAGQPRRRVLDGGAVRVRGRRHEAPRVQGRQVRHRRGVHRRADLQGDRDGGRLPPLS